MQALTAHFLNHDPGAGLLARLLRIPRLLGASIGHASWILSNLELWLTGIAISTYDNPIF